MSERDTAIALANRVLGDHNNDPDHEICVLARQFLIALEQQIVIDGTAPSLKDCIDIVRLKTEHLRDRMREKMRAKGYAEAQVAIEATSDGYTFVKLNTHKERVFGEFGFEWICDLDFDAALAKAQAVIDGLLHVYVSEDMAPWFTVEPAQEEAAQ